GQDLVDGEDGSDYLWSQNDDGSFNDNEVDTVIGNGNPVGVGDVCFVWPILLGGVWDIYSCEGVYNYAVNDGSQHQPPDCLNAPWPTGERCGGPGAGAGPAPLAGRADPLGDKRLGARTRSWQATGLCTSAPPLAAVIRRSPHYSFQPSQGSTKRR